jgi:aminoglycoside phosphotransferase (APT) family kinase protein
MSARDTLARLPIWPGPPEIEPIALGRTNQNFRVRAGGRTYFAHIGEDLPRHGIRRSVEQQVSRYVGALGIAPAIVHGDGDALVSEYLPGVSWKQDAPRSDAELKQLGRLLSVLHGAAPPDDLPRFDPVSVCHTYLAAIGPDLLSTEHRRTIERILDAAPETAPRCLVHADLIPENVMADGDRLWLVDWEYAGLGQPETDLAMVISNFGLSEDQATLLLGAHGGASAATVRSLVPAVAAREALWCVTELQAVGENGDLADYAGRCLSHLDTFS